MNEADRPMTDEEKQRWTGKLRRPHSRLVVLSNVYYQASGENPQQVDTRYSVGLETDEQPYSRRIDVSVDSKLVPYGWVEDPSLVVLQNVGKVSVDLYANDYRFSKLQPGRSFCYEPAEQTVAMAAAEATKVWVHVYPR